MQLESFNLKKFDSNNVKQKEFMKTMFSNESDEIYSYLGHMDKLEDENAYLVYNNEDHMIGYFSMSQPVINQMNLLSTSLYYAIHPFFRRQGYATKFLQEISEALLEQVDMIVLMIDQKNIASIQVAKNAHYQVQFCDNDEEDIIFVRYKNEPKHLKIK